MPTKGTSPGEDQSSMCIKFQAHCAKRPNVVFEAAQISVPWMCLACATRILGTGNFDYWSCAWFSAGDGKLAWPVLVSRCATTGKLHASTGIANNEILFMYAVQWEGRPVMCGPSFTPHPQHGRPKNDAPQSALRLCLTSGGYIAIDAGLRGRRLRKIHHGQPIGERLSRPKCLSLDTDDRDSNFVLDWVVALLGLVPQSVGAAHIWHNLYLHSSQCTLQSEGPSWGYKFLW